MSFPPIGTPGIFRTVNPPALDAPRGFVHGLLVQPGHALLFVAGQTAANAEGQVRDRGFVAQFTEALDKALTVVTAAGGRPEHIVRMTVYVTDMEAYRAARSELSAVWRVRMGRHYPAMSLVAVTGLVDREANVEIEVTAAFPATER
jgi:enamine deaminase RidA (YjgF/YER057c/UK114 family)